jgi:predicted nucleic acid-binding protein
MRGLQTIWNDWIEAARLGRRLAAVGHRLPLSDLVLAAVSLRLDAEIYSTDPHFDLISELRRFR